MATIDPKTGKQRRGFAAMDPDKRREIARKGGASVPNYKRSFFRDPMLAERAGRKGGEVTGARAKRIAP